MAKRTRRSSVRSRPRTEDFEWILAPWDALLGLHRRAHRAVADAARSVRDALRTRPSARLFAVVMLAALVFRLWPPDWYTRGTFHPDERWLLEKTANLNWPGEPGRDDPAGLQYGSLPLYAVAAVRSVAVGLFHADPYRAVIVCGRALTGCVDGLTVLAVFLLAASLAGPGPGLLAALVTACAPLHILFAHFFTVDPWLACFAAFTLVACLRVGKGASLYASAMVGVLYAAALASKSSGLPLAAPIVLAHFAPALVPGLDAEVRASRLRRGGLGLAVAAAATVAAFFVFMPWAFLDFPKFVANQTAQRDILVTGSPLGTPFVRQYWGAGPWFHLRNLCLFYMGVPAGPLALLAVPFAAALAFSEARSASRGRSSSSNRRWSDAALGTALILAWIVPYFAIIDFSFAKFARYTLPLIAPLAALLALALGRLRRGAPRLAAALAGVCALLSLGYGTGYFLTYFRPHPWYEASRWIDDHIPPVTADPAAPGGRRPTRIVNEDWGDDLPVGLPDRPTPAYFDLKDRPGQVNVVEWDSAAKLAAFCSTLSQADVLILADPRAYGTYLRLPHRFPLTYTYYHLLFTDPGRLGFALAHQASNPLKLFGLFTLEDSRIPSVPSWRWADESFTLYDRPHAFIFRRVRPMAPDQVRSALMNALAGEGLSDRFLDGLGPDDLESLASGKTPLSGAPPPTAAPVVNPNFGRSRGALTPLGPGPLVWWFLVTVLGALALPLSARVLRGLPAGGYALSRALGVLLFGWIAYNLAWLFPGFWPFWQDRLWILLAVLAASAAFLLRRRRRAAAAWIRENRAEILATEAVFAAAFGVFVLIRAYNPNIHDVTGQGYFGGGEPLGMTYLSAVTRCATFPAFDPWLALANSSYYYFGYVLMATLTKLSGLAPAVAYNLSLALCFALTVTGAYGILRAFTRSRWVAVGGAAMVGLSGTLWTVAYVALRTLHGQESLLSAWFSHGFIWDPTRFPELVQGHIFEFPFFSYLYGDLHPHNIVLGFSILLLALFLRPFLARARGWKAFGGRPGDAALWLMVTALVLDAQYAINTWSWPVFVGLGALALAVGPWAGKGLGLRARAEAAVWGVGFLAAALFMGRALMFGFRHYFIQDGAARLGLVHPSEWMMSAYIPLAYYLPGLLALALLGGLRLKEWGASITAELGYKGRTRGLDRWALLGPRHWDRHPVADTFRAVAVGAAACLFLWATLRWQSQGVWALALGLGLSWLVLGTMGGGSSGREAFVWVLGISFCGMVAGTEFFFVADRMNTIFKVWMNGWVFMGLVFGAGFALALERVPAAAIPARRRAAWDRSSWWTWGVAAGLAAAVGAAAWADASLLDRGGRFLVSYLLFGSLILGVLAAVPYLEGQAYWRRALRGLFLGILALGLFYPVGAVGRRLWEASQFRDPHLDGMRFMAGVDARPGLGANDYDRHDYALIEWLNRHADVTETVAEAPGLELYQGFNRFSIYTGLPTLLGWEYQVGQQLGPRAGDILQRRERDAAVIYGPDRVAAAALLKRFRVRWIVVGTIERRLYPKAGLDKFADMATVADRDGPSVLYRYDWDKP